jgi:hypothetical protein
MKKDNRHKAYAMILKRLLKGKTLTASQFAQETGNVKLSSRVGELIELGFPIAKPDTFRPSGTRIKKYFIETRNIQKSKELAVKLEMI